MTGDLSRRATDAEAEWTALESVTRDSGSNRRSHATAWPHRAASGHRGACCSAVIALVLGLVTSLPAQSAAPRVALVLDQEAPGLEPQVAAFKREIQGFFRPGEITLLAPRAGDGTAAGVSRALDRALSDSSVAAVVALGPIGSHLLAHAGEPKKPAIAATIVDAGWQGIPEKDGASGVHNLAYVDESYALSGTVADFHRMIPFRRMAVLLDPELLARDSRARGQRPLSRPRRRRRRGGHPGAGHGRSDPGRAAGRRRRRLPHPDTRRLARPRRRA